MSTASTTDQAPWLVGEGLELGEQGLYKLPRDHAWHSGPSYFCNDFQEWHYFTLLGTDKRPAIASRCSGMRSSKDGIRT
jgi:hypothetical protein